MKKPQFKARHFFTKETGFQICQYANLILVNKKIKQLLIQEQVLPALKNIRYFYHRRLINAKQCFYTLLFYILHTFVNVGLLLLQL